MTNAQFFLMAAFVFMAPQMPNSRALLAFVFLILATISWVSA